MSILHITVAVRDVKRSIEFFQKTVGWTPIKRPANLDRPAGWMQIATNQELHLIQVTDYEPSRFEREFGRHIAIAYPKADFSTLQEKLIANGAALIEAERPTPFARFFFRDPDGYIFEVVDRDRESEVLES